MRKFAIKVVCDKTACETLHTVFFTFHFEKFPVGQIFYTTSDLDVFIFWGSFHLILLNKRKFIASCLDLSRHRNWTRTRIAQVRIRRSRDESSNGGSVLAISCSIIERGALVLVQQIHFAPGSNENRHNSRVITGGQVQRWTLITIQSVDVGSCLDESVHDCGRALELGSKMQGGHLGGK